MGWGEEKGGGSIDIYVSRGEVFLFLLWYKIHNLNLTIVIDFKHTFQRR